MWSHTNKTYQRWESWKDESSHRRKCGLGIYRELKIIENKWEAILKYVVEVLIWTDAGQKWLKENNKKTKNIGSKREMTN